ncbi:Protein-disulfide reductase [Candidatus Magnetobacterium bavaricum]|uniref:Protein-disulfide reductase n=1 Tax=Candidatus Magnetobacterium bavaricum TaxID=29290 RepID=A0A0F3GY52_9BACT|nr:Protein-disulfide reductase [Candidatus Magnetobacterium bavaricum]
MGLVDYIRLSIGDPSVLSIFLAYIGGVLASLTPCVYPMIPIVMGIIGAASATSRLRGFTLSLSYAIGLSIVYTALGMIASLTGSFFGEISTNPWSYLIFGNLCLILAFWMMDWVDIPVFSSVKTTDRGGYIGAFITGMLSGLVAAPCTSPVLAGLLIYTSTTKNAILGGLMLFFFSMGMTTILIIIGTFSGVMKSLPKPGNWMVWLKKGTALVLIGLGEYFLIKSGGGFSL